MTGQDAAQMLGVAAFPEGWDFHPVHRRAQLAGWLCTKGSEVHAFRLPAFAGCWLTRQTLARVARPLLAQFGVITTIVRESNCEGQAFVARMGFQETKRDAQGVHYSTKKVKHARL